MSGLAIVGRGRVGTALAAAFEAAGQPVALHAARALPPTIDAETILLCVRDPMLESVAREVVARAPDAVFLHTAGAVSSEVLFSAGARAAAVFHPLAAFAGVAPKLAGAVFAIEGDQEGRAVAVELATRLGGEPLHLDAARLALYHAAATLASNHVLALVAIAQSLLGRMAVAPDRALAGLTSLFRGVADNLEALGLPMALTGPVARGDVAAVDRHLAALNEHPEAKAAYLATLDALIQLAAAKGAADPRDLAELRARLPLYPPPVLD